MFVLQCKNKDDDDGDDNERCLKDRAKIIGEQTICEWSF